MLDLLRSTDDADDTDTTEDEDAGATVGLDDVYDLLANQRRRQVVDALADRRSWTTADLAEQIAAAETDKHPDKLDSQERKRAYVALHQCHLDRLDEADVIRYDKNRQQVTRAPSYPAVERVLQDTRDALRGDA